VRGKGILVLFEMAYRELTGENGVVTKEIYTHQDVSAKLSQLKSALENPRSGYDANKVFVELEAARRKLKKED
jgi:hypothetical protein